MWGFSEFNSLYKLKIDKSCVKKWLNLHKCKEIKYTMMNHLYFYRDMQIL